MAKEINKQDKLKALAAAMGQIDKKFGAGSVMKLGENKKMDINFISTGSLALDLAIGGGIPRGRITEIYGPESSGKTTLTLSAIAEAQKQGLICAFVDAEHALDPTYAKKLGVNIDELIISQPDSGEQALEIALTLTESGAVDVIIIDSVAALVPKAELEGEVGDSHMGLAARMMSQALRKITGVAKQNEVALIFINQIRMKIGVMFGSPETTTGGNALKFYASLRLDIRRTGKVEGDKVDPITKSKEVIGSETTIKVVKNKVAPPFRQAKTRIMYGKGFDLYGEILDFGAISGVLEKAGAYYRYNGENIGQGKDKTIATLLANPSMKEEIETKVRKHFEDNNEELVIKGDREAVEIEQDDEPPFQEDEE